MGWSAWPAGGPGRGSRWCLVVQMALNSTVEVGLVIGVIAMITPRLGDVLEVELGVLVDHADGPSLSRR